MTLRALFDVAAPAKLNYFLHVTGRRADGYHLLQSLFVLIDWCDTLHFVRRDGYLCDNPRIGPDLAKAYWRPGNSLTLNEMLRSLTGESLSPVPLARALNRTAEEAVAEAHAQIARGKDVPQFRGRVDLDASITVIHGREEIARLDGDFARFAQQFAQWIEQQTPKT
jgi:hypothetical protein